MEQSEDSLQGGLAMHPYGETGQQQKQAFFIKKLPSKECCQEILGLAFYREEVSSLMKLLSKQSITFAEQNTDFILRMRSKISYSFSIPSQLTLHSLKTLNL